MLCRGKDTVVGASGRDRIYGNEGDDLILARDRKRDTLYGGDGSDTASVDNTSTIDDLWAEIEKLLA
jgi:Ca2+-binding RTX toxin-like protein